MADFGTIWTKVSGMLVNGPVRRPLDPIRIPADHVAGPPKAPSTDQKDRIEPQQGYVGIRINQLYLHHNRRWFTEIEPVVYSATEFQYAGKTRTDAIVVGPRRDDLAPSGMALINSSVFGVHPYRGDDFVHTIILSSMPTNNLARGLIDLVQGVASAIGVGASVEVWTKLGSLVLSGFDKLVGSANLTPIMGAKLTFNPDRNEPLRPGYFAMIDDADVDPKQLWVVNSKLRIGPDASSAEDYRESDYVLYELTAAPDSRRTDYERLPFIDLWNEAVAGVEDTSDDAWKKTKATLASLTLAIYRSPDLIGPQRDEVASMFVEELVRLRKKFVAIAAQSGDSQETPSGGERRLRARVEQVLELS